MLTQQSRFELARNSLIELSHRIHAQPELGFEEEKASSWLCESLTEAGFSVEKGVCDWRQHRRDSFSNRAIAPVNTTYARYSGAPQPCLGAARSPIAAWMISPYAG